MSVHFSHTSSLTKIIIIVEFVLVAYLVYSLTKNVYNSYQIDKYITAFEMENAQIEAENRQKSEDYLYFTSEEYMDRIAKQNLGLINPGEEVIILSPDVLEEESVFGGEEIDMDPAQVDRRSHASEWWDFFFGN